MLKVGKSQTDRDKLMISTNTVLLGCLASEIMDLIKPGTNRTPFKKQPHVSLSLSGRIIHPQGSTMACVEIRVGNLLASSVGGVRPEVNSITLDQWENNRNSKLVHFRGSPLTCFISLVNSSCFLRSVVLKLHWVSGSTGGLAGPPPPEFRSGMETESLDF